MGMENGTSKKAAPINIGDKFGKWTVIEYKGLSKNKEKTYLCQCECGRTSIISSTTLRKGKSKQCISCANKKENPYARERLYLTWQGMKQRCLNPKQDSYKYYGGRGISICKEWMDYLAFKDWALKSGYDPDAPRGECTIDRIDYNGNYEPSNCRWVSMKEQRINKRDIHWITYNGETKTLSQWAESLNLKPHSLLRRLKNYPIEIALSKPKSHKGEYRIDGKSRNTVDASYNDRP